MNKIKIIGVLGLLFGSILLSSCANADAVEMKVTAALVAGDSIRVSVYVTPASNVDSTRVTVTSSTGPTQTRTLGGASRGTLLFLFGNVAEGQTASGQVTAISYRLGVASVQSAPKSWSFTRGVTPPAPPVIDSVTVQQIAMALSVAHPLGDVLVIRTSGDTCSGQWYDYYGMLMLGPSGPQSAPCDTSFSDRSTPSQIGYMNAIAVMMGDSARMRWPKYDSLWRAGQV